MRQWRLEGENEKPAAMKPEAMARLLCDIEELMNDYRLTRLVKRL